MDPKNRNEKEVFQQLKKMIPQLLLSVSIFSFLFSYSSSLLYPASKSQYYFSADSLHFLSHAVLDKNCLFLICNGLLVFLSKTSGFIRPPDLDDALHKRIGDSLQTALQKYVLEEVAVHEKEDDEDEKTENSTESTAEEVSIFVAESEEESGEGCDLEENDTDQLDFNRFWLLDEEDDDQQQVYGDHENEEEEEEEMSTEELNRKIEDFIRRMKEEIIVNEATHKEMVIVN